VFFYLPAEALATGCTFWQRVTGSTLSPPRGSRNEFATLIPEDGDAFLRVQRVDRPGSGYHLDVHVDEIDTAVSQALSLGATAADGPSPVSVLWSPAGMTFCVVAHHGEARRPPPLAWAAGHRSLVDQVCVDIPPQVFDDECDFWEALTGWERRTGSRSEFVTWPALPACHCASCSSVSTTGTPTRPLAISTWPPPMSLSSGIATGMPQSGS